MGAEGNPRGAIGAGSPTWGKEQSEETVGHGDLSIHRSVFVAIRWASFPDKPVGDPA